MAFAHLHVHTEYSLLDGSCKMKELTARAKELGMNSLAITDHGVMYGVIDFYRAAKEAGIKPIIGCEIYVSPGSRFDKEAAVSDDRYYHLVLLAENNQGYANLVKIVSKGFVEGFYYRPRVDYEVLETYHEGLIALSACLAGEVPRFIQRGMYAEAKEAALRYERIFGKGNFFLELQDHGIPEQQTVNTALLRMSEELGIELVATNDIHYTFAEDAVPHDLLLCIQTGKKVSDENRLRYEGGQYYCKSEDEMRELFPYALQALENTQRIADRCLVEIEFGVMKLPEYSVPDGKNAWDYLNELAWEGLKRRYPQEDKTLAERLTYELNTIREMGYVDYFLIVWDFINYARQNGIAVGPGRGSAAGSLVSYALGITDIDPIRYNLLFERFLNPERISMPDIDVDFCYERRQEVIDYVVHKYGKERVVQIITFGTMAAKGVIRDVGRVLDLPYAFCDQVAKMIPVIPNDPETMTIAKAMEINRELKALYETDERAKNLIDLSRRLEGLPRHTSMHAAGVVIGPKAIDEFVPLSRGADGSITTQFTMTTIEELGLLKMDFLGLRTLTVIQNAVRMVNRDRKREDWLDIGRIDQNDRAVLDTLSTGKTDGIFQLESGGMRSFMKELHPESMEDIIAGVALYRPGPMDFIPQYIRGKKNAGNVQYLCPQLEPILKPTYGCIVYQEQVMQIVRDLGGYTLGRSDLVRRAMSKKKQSVMEKERQNFVYGNEEEGICGCIRNGIGEETANKIYDSMMDFARYAFNKSHAAAYAVVAYQTAYLKYYHPVEFMAALMTSVMDNVSKLSEYFMACKQMDIEILPPDINEGEAAFSVSKGAIRYGLSAIKSVGRNVIDAIIAEREENGLYTGIKDFIYRLSSKEVNKRTLENFIKSGALDGLPGNRRQKMLVSAELLERKNSEKKNSMAGQISLFDWMGGDAAEEYEVKFPPVEEYPKEELLTFEKEVVGMYLSGHPMEEYEESWRRQVTNVTTDFYLDDETGMPKIEEGRRVIIGGMITGKTLKTTKNNQMMAFLTLEDLLGSVEVIVFPRDYEKYRERLVEDSKAYIRGRVSSGVDENAKCVLEYILPFDEVEKELWFQFADLTDYGRKEEALLEALRDADGNSPVGIFLKEERKKKILPPSKNVRISQELLRKLRDLFGEENVRVLEKSLKNEKK